MGHFILWQSLSSFNGDYLKPNIYSVGHMVWLPFYGSLNFQFQMTIYLKLKILRQRGSSLNSEGRARGAVAYKN